MIDEKNYRRMATEVLALIDIYPNSIKEKIPHKLIEELKRHRLPDLKVQLDESKKLYEQDVCDETVVMMYMIYRHYIGGSEEKEKFDQVLKGFDEQIRAQYNPDNLFKNKGNSNSSQEPTH